MTKRKFEGRVNCEVPNKYIFIGNLGDGVSHVNISMDCKVIEFRSLCPHAYKPFEHPKLGKFASMSGLLMYLRSGMKQENVRDKYGTGLTGVKRVDPDMSTYMEYLEQGVLAQYSQHPELIKVLKSTGDLPLVNYHIFGSSLKNKSEQKLLLVVLGKLRADYYESTLEAL